MAKRIDQEATTIEEINSLHSQIPRGWCMPHCGGHMEEAPGLVRRQREQGENVGRSLYCGFHEKEPMKQGKQVRLTSLNNIGMLWGIRTIPSCVISVPGVIRAG